MATRKGIHISGNYATPHTLNALFIYVLFKIIFYILFKTQRPDTVFYFRDELN